jgi:hypothetical protein
MHFLIDYLIKNITTLYYIRMYKSTKQKSMFGKGLLCNHHPMFGKVLMCSEGGTNNIFSGMSSSSSDMLKDLYLNVGQYLETLFHNYSLGRIDDVATTLTREYYEQLSVKLYKERQPNKEYYEGIRVIMNRALEGLNKSILEHAEFLKTLTQLQECQEKVDILNDADKLNEYIKELNQQSKSRHALFQSQEVTAMMAMLKPKYARYLELYGFPEGGIFEADKLAAICEELELENGENNNVIVDDLNNNGNDDDC